MVFLSYTFWPDMGSLNSWSDPKSKNYHPVHHHECFGTLYVVIGRWYGLTIYNSKGWPHCAIFLWKINALSKMMEVPRHNSVTVIFPAECNSLLELVLEYVDYWWVFVCNKFGTLIIWWELIYSQKACKRKFKWKVGIHGVQNIFKKYLFV